VSSIAAGKLRELRMKLLLTAALALNLVGVNLPLSGPELDRALRNYRAMLAGQKQLADLTLTDRRDVIELDRWLRSPEGSSHPKRRSSARNGLLHAHRQPSKRLSST
jgi:hypothetical protein